MRAAVAKTLALALGLLACASEAAGEGGDAAGARAAAIRGAVALGIEGIPLASVAPVVVYLEPLGAVAAPLAPLASAALHQQNARFAPSFQVVSAGQRVEMHNDDAIYHNVFSYSRPNEFDLGLYPAGEARSLALDHAGVVKIYCSIHESMNATILVVPTRWFDTVGASGRYAISGIEPGRYRVVVWSEKLPLVSREVEFAAGATETRDWVVGSPGDAAR